MKLNLRPWRTYYQQHQRELWLAGTMFLAGVVVRDRWGWLWEHVLLYLFMPVIGLVGIAIYVSLVGMATEAVTDQDLNSPAQRRIRDLLTGREDR